jgi:hypothetical protein
MGERKSGGRDLYLSLEKPMSDTMIFNCPECGHEMRLPAAFVGQQGKCSGCDEVVTPIPVFDSLSQDEPGLVKSESDSPPAQPEAQSAPAPAVEETAATELEPLEMGNMTFAKENLTEGETVLHAGRFHRVFIWAAYIGLLPAILLLIFFAWGTNEEFSSISFNGTRANGEPWSGEPAMIGDDSDEWSMTYVSGFAKPVFWLLFSGALILIGLCWWIWRCYCYNKVYKTEFVLTNKRIITKWGFLRTVSREIQLEKIESVNYGQIIIERWFGIGRLTVRGTGGGKVGKFKYLLDALEFRNRILDQIDKASGS